VDESSWQVETFCRTTSLSSWRCLYVRLIIVLFIWFLAIKTNSLGGAASSFKFIVRTVLELLLATSHNSPLYSQLPCFHRMLRGKNFKRGSCLEYLIKWATWKVLFYHDNQKVKLASLKKMKVFGVLQHKDLSQTLSLLIKFQVLQFYIFNVMQHTKITKIWVKL